MDLNGAAVLVTGLMVGGWLWQQPMEVVVPPGRQLLLTLPDGSTAQLNSDSRLRYRRGFQTWPFVPASERTLWLDGEAFFEVVAEAERSFVVETFNARVQVLGTQFNVRARRGPWEDETQVVLAEGRVRVTTSQDSSYVALLSEVGQTVRVSQTSRPDPVLQSEGGALRLAWRRQGFEVVDKPLAFILAEVERRFAVSIAVEGRLALTDSMSLFYPEGAVAGQILHDICLAQGCRYRKTSGGFTLAPSP